MLTYINVPRAARCFYSSIPTFLMTVIVCRSVPGALRNVSILGKRFKSFLARYNTMALVQSCHVYLPTYSKNQKSIVRRLLGSSGSHSKSHSFRSIAYVM